MEEPTRKEPAGRSLHICPDCGSALVQPTLWEQQENHCHWRVWRRCPECEWACEGIHDEVEIDAFDAQLDQAAHELADELRSLEQANMSAMAEAFLIALRNDLISAEDFA
jgi:phage-related protein